MVTAGSIQQLLHPQEMPSAPGRLQASAGDPPEQAMRSQLEEALAELQAAMLTRDKLQLQAAIRILVKHVASVSFEGLQLQGVRLCQQSPSGMSEAYLNTSSRCLCSSARGMHYDRQFMSMSRVWYDHGHTIHRMADSVLNCAVQANNHLLEAKHMLRAIQEQQHVPDHDRLPLPMQNAPINPLNSAAGAQRQLLGCMEVGPNEGQDDACVVCMETEVQVLFRPCIHAVTCQACSALLAGRSNECPICRCNVKQRQSLDPSQCDL